MENTTFKTSLGTKNTPSLQETHSKNALVHLPHDWPIKRREDADPPTSNHQKKSGRKRERLAEAQVSATPKPSETMRAGNAAGRNQRCGHLRFHFGGGGITPSPPAFLPTPSPSPCVSTATSCAIHPFLVPDSPPGVTTSTPAPPAFHHLHPRRRSRASPISKKTLIC